MCIFFSLPGIGNETHRLRVLVLERDQVRERNSDVQAPLGARDCGGVHHVGWPLHLTPHAATPHLDMWERQREAKQVLQRRPENVVVEEEGQFRATESQGHVLWSSPGWLMGEETTALCHSELLDASL